MTGRIDVRAVGFGGQGIITIAKVIGNAAVIGSSWDSAMTEYYGPEVTGGWCRADLALHPNSVGFPVVTDPEVLVAFSMDGYERNRHQLSAGGVLLYESDVVIPEGLPEGAHAIPVPAFKLAEQAGEKRAANLAMLGAFNRLFPFIPREDLLDAALKAVPAKKKAENAAAFEAGEVYAQNWLDERSLKVAPGRAGVSSQGVVE